MMTRYLNLQGDPLYTNKKHPDGSYCLENHQRCPEEGKPCCTLFEDHTVACVYDLRYEWWAKPGFWVVRLADSAGGGGIKISFCPHCGSELWKPS